MVTQGGEVFGGTVSFVAGKIEMGIVRRQVSNQLVAVDLGDDGSGGDGSTAGVAVDDAGLREARIGGGEVDDHGVHKEMVRQLGKPGNCIEHCQPRSVVDIDPVDGLHINRRDGDADSVLMDAGSKSFTGRLRDQFRIAQAADAVVGRKNDGCSDDGAEEASATDFIDPGDQFCSLRPSQLLKFTGAFQGLEQAQLGCRQREFLFGAIRKEPEG